MTVVSVVVLALFLWYGLGWVFFSADWDSDRRPGRPTHNRAVQHRGRVPGSELLLEAAGGRCCWCRRCLGWRGGSPEAVSRKRIAITVVVVLAAFALLPYGLDTMGMDVRALLVANLPAAGSRVGAGALHSTGYTEMDCDSRGSSLSPNPGLAAGTAGGSRSSAGCR